MIDAAQFKLKTVYVYSAATPQKVWQALTDAAFTKAFFHGLAVEVEPGAGGKFLMCWPDDRKPLPVKLAPPAAMLEGLAGAQPLGH